MARPDSGALDRAVIARLGGDPELVALMPDGVFFDVAPHGSKRFVLVTLEDATDEPRQGGRAFETATYVVRAVGLSTDVTNDVMDAAAARIDVLLDDGSLDVGPDFTLMSMVRTRRLRTAPFDTSDPSLNWFNRGGHYQLQASVPSSLWTQPGPPTVPAMGARS